MHSSTATQMAPSDEPDLADLDWLEFQVPRQPAPMPCELPLRHLRKKTSCQDLRIQILCW
ncbi:hypothetical protein CRG98_001491 [Punica granatum]|uniref:Uncharacterized protein n=1 Tax=Punica granatum TaxID=22663 RepID=A0A2I0LBV2_PUNGR|nr:hypothetical protein CRG98_001491 [Punica granatum]